MSTDAANIDERLDRIESMLAALVSAIGSARPVLMGVRAGRVLGPLERANGRSQLGGVCFQLALVGSIEHELQPLVEDLVHRHVGPEQVCLDSASGARAIRGARLPTG